MSPARRPLVSVAMAAYDAGRFVEQALASLSAQTLDDLEILYSLNPWLVRGLDYYGHTTFEFTTGLLGVQGTVLAGGRSEIRERATDLAHRVLHGRTGTRPSERQHVLHHGRRRRHDHRPRTNRVSG